MRPICFFSGHTTSNMLQFEYTGNHKYGGVRRTSLEIGFEIDGVYGSKHDFRALCWNGPPLLESTTHPDVFALQP